MLILRYYDEKLLKNTLRIKIKWPLFIKQQAYLFALRAINKGNSTFYWNKPLSVLFSYLFSLSYSLNQCFITEKSCLSPVHYHAQVFWHYNLISSRCHVLIIWTCFFWEDNSRFYSFSDDYSSCTFFRSGKA